MLYDWTQPLTGDPEWYLNQTARFENASELVRYMCSATQPFPFSPKPTSEDDPHLIISGNTTYPDPSYHDIFNFEPVCPFPYVNKGWKYDLTPTGRLLNGTNVVLGDCSQTMAESTDGFYDRLCFFYTLINIIPGVITLLFLTIYSSIKFADEKGKKGSDKKHLWLIKGKVSFSKHANVSEQMCWINVFVCFLHAVMTTDTHGWYGNISIQMRTTMSACLTASAIHIAITMVTSWIALIDGGKLNQPPRWATLLKRSAYAQLYINEVACSILQYHVGMARNYELYMNGSVVAWKNTFYCIVCLTYAILGFIYGRKITNMLNNGSGKVSSSEKRVRRYCYNCTFVMLIATYWKAAPTIMWNMRTNNYYGLHPCKLSSFSLIDTFYSLLQYLILYNFQPGKVKATTRLIQGIASTVKRSGSSNVTSRNSNTTKGDNGSSKGSSGSSGKKSSLNSSTSSSTSSSKNSSSVQPSDMSGVSELSEISGTSSMESGVSEYDEVEH
ncbi:hypothetical protein ScalyP_jg8385 [Parmales sp. scaly parma]|nr:hypothetical protein ScalyP_jg8385 [Parmales sp. scaly parma]